MARIQEAIPTSLPSAQRTRRVDSPLASVYERVGSAVAQEIARRRAKKNTLREKGRRRSRRPAVEARAVTAERELEQELEREVSAAMAQVLERSLDALSSVERMALIARLARDAGQTGAELTQPPAKTADLLLTTAEVATRLEVSRPYVAMLCDAGKLGNVIKTEGGHRRVAQSAVSAYLAQRDAAYADAPSMRESGLAAGLYGQDDAHYVTEPRVAAAPVGRPARKAPAKARGKAPERIPGK
jgi:excisionase family DNA binding protein